MNKSIWKRGHGNYPELGGLTHEKIKNSFFIEPLLDFLKNWFHVSDKRI
jgi:hypothetical protein